MNIDNDETVAGWFAAVKKLVLCCKVSEHLETFVKDRLTKRLPKKGLFKLCEEHDAFAS